MTVEKGGRKEHKPNEQKFQKTHLYGCMERGEGYASLSEGDVNTNKRVHWNRGKDESDDGKGVMRVMEVYSRQGGRVVRG
jgi:hypothetical protein